MEIARLLLGYLDVLVWPLVVVAVLIGYRATVKQLLARIVRLDAVGVSATFDKASRQAEQITGVNHPHSVPTRPATDLAAIRKLTPTDFKDARQIGELSVRLSRSLSTSARCQSPTASV